MLVVLKLIIVEMTPLGEREKKEENKGEGNSTGYP